VGKHAALTTRSVIKKEIGKGCGCGRMPGQEKDAKETGQQGGSHERGGEISGPAPRPGNATVKKTHCQRPLKKRGRAGKESK